MEPRWPERPVRFVAITTNENSMTPMRVSSRGRFSRAVVTLATLVVAFRIWVMRFVWVCVTEALLVEKKVDVSVVPMTVTDMVVTLRVDVEALATAVTVVTLVLIVKVLTTVC